MLESHVHFSVVHMWTTFLKRKLKFYIDEKIKWRVWIFFSGPAFDFSAHRGGYIMEFDTIAAISTPSGEGAIAIVRLSGPEAISIADRLFRAPSGKQLASQTTHTIHYGHLEDPWTEETVEEVMVSF